MTYQSTLPKEFPIMLVLPEARVAEFLAVLISPDALATNGSSFAVTVDTVSEGYRVLWMSRTSHERLKASDVWKKEL